MPSTPLPGTGLLKGLGVTIRNLARRPATLMYPHERQALPPRTRGVIALIDENCTVCMLCSRECPDWCIYIDSHKETVPPAREGGRARTRNVLDRFAIDFALCMYCGICVEVCPFDALWWSPEFEYCEYSIDGLLHEMPRLRAWADTVPPPPLLEEGAEQPAEVAAAIGKAEQERAARAAAQRPAAPAAAATGPAAAGPRPAAAPAEDFEVKAGEIDQEVFDALLAEGKPERIARAKAKAAYVKKEKARLRAEAAAAAPAPVEAAADAAAPDAPAPAPAPAAASPAPAEVHVEAGQIDQEVFDALLAEGKPERIARAKAKAAYVKKEKARLRAEAAAAAPAPVEAAADAAAPDAAAPDAAAPDAPAPAPSEATTEPAAAPQQASDAGTARKLSDVHVEGTGEIDQAVYDALIAEGKSERIARAKAKAAWIKQRKQAMLDQEEGS